MPTSPIPERTLPSSFSDVSRPLPGKTAGAGILFWGSRVGMAFLALVAVIYFLLLLPSHVPPPSLPAFWNLSAAEFVAQCDIPTGWHWLQHLQFSDCLATLAMSGMAFLPLLAYAAMLVHTLRRRLFGFSLLIILQTLILALAAAGILGFDAH